MNRAQQAYHFEKQSFSNADPQATNNALGILLDSGYYTFSVESASATDAINDATAGSGVDDGVRNYEGAISYSGGVYDTAVCQSDEINGAVAGSASSGAAGCTAGTELEERP